MGEVEQGDLEQESLPVRFAIIHYNYYIILSSVYYVYVLQLYAQHYSMAIAQPLDIKHCNTCGLNNMASTPFNFCLRISPHVSFGSHLDEASLAQK